ncbi:hypothetical protein P389DRAFT_71158 [Cystobasidium minutum MCA 4210]|uniref:uncharacterized protein n=1 Tax=Cystobasidium minutum MCA 4210 TaxID=1397322 RepID=UPI0034CFD552|eukprot:jgi/Rhomi1/71158/CE71157_674
MNALRSAPPARLLRQKASGSLRCPECLSAGFLLSSARRRSRWIPTVESPSTGGARRSYATEADVIPKAILIRSPPPPAPTTQGQPPESATSLQYPSTRHDQIDGLLHHFHESVFANDGSCARLPELYDQLSSRAGKMVDHELPFEDTPQKERRIPTEDGQAGKTTWLDSCKLAEARLSSNQPSQPVQEDGLVLVAHVVNAEPLPIISWSLGFAVNTKENSQYVVSCSHTLESAMHAYNSANAHSSSTFIVTRSGDLLAVNSIASSLPLYDIVLYDFAKPPGKTLRAAPVALHPPAHGAGQSLYSVTEDKWRATKVVGYKDPRGNDAEPGTYDELNSISIDVLPTPGSSGGPLVSENGAVTALIRGSRMAYGERGSVGFATPAEKIFEMFQLPGLRRPSP